MLNYPIEGELAQAFWSSANKCNRVRAICAYSLDEEDANRNLTRSRFSNSFRKKVLSARGIGFANPSMVGIPFNKGNTPIWDCLEEDFQNGHFALWDDNMEWGDMDGWVEWIPAKLDWMDGGKDDSNV